MVGLNTDQKMVYMSEIEMADLPWFNVEEGIKKLLESISNHNREIEM